jgi:hypothetical protein
MLLPLAVTTAFVISVSKVFWKDALGTGCFQYGDMVGSKQPEGSVQAEELGVPAVAPEYDQMALPTLELKLKQPDCASALNQ